MFEELYRDGKIELELVPQGTLAERMRAAGAGVARLFYTPTAFGTKLAEGKPTAEIAGRNCVLEYALHGDVALIEAWEADRWGNLVYNASGRNFNPVMATRRDAHRGAGAACRRARSPAARMRRDTGRVCRPRGAGAA